MDPVGLARIARRGHHRATRSLPRSSAAARSLVFVLVVGAGAALAAPPERGAYPSPTGQWGATASPVIVVTADRDDDDADGRPDGSQETLPLAARADLVPLDRALVGSQLHPIRGGDCARVVVDGRPLAWDRPIPAGATVQGLHAGSAQLVVMRPGGGGGSPLAIEVRGFGMRDGVANWVDFARDHASVERTPPARVEGLADATYDDPDALRIVIEQSSEVAERAIPGITVESVSAAGTHIDTLDGLTLGASSCRPGASGVRCVASTPVRFVMDDVDRLHPLVVGRSLRAEVGGAIVVREGGRKLQAIRVLGPRRTAAGPLGRMRATIRPFVTRVTNNGAPSIGGTDAGAVASLRAELALASAIWGQCGLSFGPPAATEVRVVNPPPPYLLAIGDDAGLPASGGEIHLRAEGHVFSVAIPRGATPDRIAREVVRALDQKGLQAVVSSNARIAPGATGSVDVLVRRKDGTLATLEPLSPGAALTTDSTLVVRIGSVDLSDGLQHFGDMDSVAGTLEERTLLKAIDDGDPHTVEVVVVPSFAGGGRIGESFIASDFSSLRNVVLLDRAGVRARRSSLTLAHELGHVLMDMPGHPDDFGIDTPTLLMDSDASDASPFGPRRLTLDECARVVRQAGPKARLPLLTEWPVGPLTYAPTK